MNYWLLKTEPETFSWDMQKKKGAKGEPWSGVRNHTAKRNMMAMKKGDLGFFYHTGEEKAVVGIVEVIGEGNLRNASGDRRPTRRLHRRGAIDRKRAVHVVIEH